MQAALSAQSSVFVAPRLSKAASTTKVSARAPRAAQPVRCMAFDAKKAAQSTVSTLASISLLVQPALAYNVSDDLKGIFDTPAPAASAAPAAPAAAGPAPTIAVKSAPAPAMAEVNPAEAEELKKKALALKAELQASLVKEAPVEKKVKNFATKEKSAPAAKAVAVKADDTYKAPPAPKAKEEGDPSFLYAMLLVFSPFLLVTGYNVVNLVGAVQRKM